MFKRLQFDWSSMDSAATTAVACTAPGSAQSEQFSDQSGDDEATDVANEFGHMSLLDDTEINCQVSESLLARHVLGQARARSVVFQKPRPESRPMCLSCARPSNACLCSSLPKVPFNNCRCRVVILQHPHTHTSIGTIRLLACSLKYCQILAGLDFPDILASPHHSLGLTHETSVGQSAASNHRIDPDHLAVIEQLDMSAQVFLLYPSSSASPVEIHGKLLLADPPIHTSHTDATTSHNTDSASVMCECGAPANHSFTTIIALDGSWRYAKSIMHHNKQLAAHVTRTFCIGQHALSPYGQLKREPADHCISTAEAVAFAVSILECGDPTTIPDIIRPALQQLIDIQLAYYQRAALTMPKVDRSDPSRGSCRVRRRLKRQEQKQLRQQKEERLKQRQLDQAQRQLLTTQSEHTDTAD